MDKRDAGVLIGIIAGTGTAVSMVVLLANGIIKNPFIWEDSIYFLNIIQILVPTKIPTARTINNGMIICPSSIMNLDKLFV